MHFKIFTNFEASEKIIYWSKSVIDFLTQLFSYMSADFCHTTWLIVLSLAGNIGLAHQDRQTSLK